MKAILFLITLTFSSFSNSALLYSVFGDEFDPPSNQSKLQCDAVTCSAVTTTPWTSDADDYIYQEGDYVGDVGLYFWYQTPKSFTAEIAWSANSVDGEFAFNESLIPLEWEAAPHSYFPDEPIMSEQFIGSGSETFQFEFKELYVYRISLGGKGLHPDAFINWLISDLDYEDTTPVSEVPVPAALYLFAPALLGFMGLRRKRS